MYALAYPLVQTLASTMIQSGFMIYNTYCLVEAGMKTIKSKPAKKLADRAAAIAETLQGVDQNILLTSLGQRIVQTLVDSIAWALEYCKKNKLSKIIGNSGYVIKFRCYHTHITRDFSDIAHGIIIKTYEPKVKLKRMNRTFNHGELTEVKHFEAAPLKRGADDILIRF